MTNSDEVVLSASHIPNSCHTQTPQSTESLFCVRFFFVADGPGTGESKYHPPPQRGSEGLQAVILPDGVVLPTAEFFDDPLLNVLLLILDANIGGVGVLLGNLMGACIFCQHELKNDAPMQRGCGKTCQQKFGVRDGASLHTGLQTGTHPSFRHALPPPVAPPLGLSSTALEYLFKKVQGHQPKKC